MLIASGRACGDFVICISFRQYTTSIPMIVKGRMSAKYLIYFGMGLFSGRRMKGRALVNSVPKAIIAKKRIN
jgi:hypothetical protein